MHLGAYKYNIPPTTLHDCLSGKSAKASAGGPKVHSSEKRALTSMWTWAMDQHKMWLQEWCVITCMTMPVQIHSLTESQGRTGGRDSWSSGSSMSERKLQHLTTKRVCAEVPEIINVWFDLVEDMFMRQALTHPILLLWSVHGIVTRWHFRHLPQQPRSLHVEVPKLYTWLEVALDMSTSQFSVLGVDMGSGYPNSFIQG